MQGHKKNTKRVAKELDTLIRRWVEEHKEKRRKAGESKVVGQDFMDVMITLLKDADFADFDADTICKATCLVKSSNAIIGNNKNH